MKNDRLLYLLAVAAGNNSLGHRPLEMRAGISSLSSVSLTSKLRLAQAPAVGLGKVEHRHRVCGRETLHSRDKNFVVVPARADEPAVPRRGDAHEGVGEGEDGHG